MVIDMGEKAAEFRAKGFLAIGLVYSLKATDGKSLCVCACYCTSLTRKVDSLVKYTLLRLTLKELGLRAGSHLKIRFLNQFDINHTLFEFFNWSSLLSQRQNSNTPEIVKNSHVVEMVFDYWSFCQQVKKQTSPNLHTTAL